MKKVRRTKALSSNTTDIGRRAILKGAAIVLGTGAAMQSCAPTGDAPGESETSGVGNPSVIARDGTALVEIEFGKIAGGNECPSWFVNWDA